MWWSDPVPRRPLLLLALVMLLAGGCGFTLRGQVDLPPVLARPYVVGAGLPGALPGRVAGELRQLLALNGAALQTGHEDATAVVIFVRETIGRRELAIGRSGGVREDELVYEVVVQVTAPDGTLLMAPETFAAARNLLYDESRLLGAQSSAEVLIDDMVNDLGYTVLRRLRALES